MLVFVQITNLLHVHPTLSVRTFSMHWLYGWFLDVNDCQPHRVTSESKQCIELRVLTVTCCIDRQGSSNSVLASALAFMLPAHPCNCWWRWQQWRCWQYASLFTPIVTKLEGMGVCWNHLVCLSLCLFVCVCVCVCVSVCVSVSVRYLFLCTTHPFITKSSVVGHHQEPEHHAKKWVTNLVQTLTLKLQYSCIFFQSVSNGLGVSVGDGNISSILAHSHTACLPMETVWWWQH